MCGIAGQFRIERESETFKKEELDKMLKIIMHRGPDGEGNFIDDNIMFGMRRLSIIDLKNGWQPLYNEDCTIVCCCNGEIYNYIELKRLMENKNHKFSSNSDCEVLIHMYEEYGVDFIKELNGMFAFALYDTNKKKLILARDRLGKKPLYYTKQNGKVYFGSEIKSILVCDGMKRKENLKAMDYLLTYNYIPDIMTAFDDIYKLKPAEYMILSPERKIETYSYWDVPIEIDEYANSEEEIIDKIKYILEDSTKIRLRSDVPVGAFLSGGIDSSVVVGNGAKFLDKLQTFSIGFEEEKYNELPFAKRVAENFRTDHIVEIVNSNFIELLPKTIWLNDEPHGDVSFLSTFVLAHMTAKYVKTVLTGDGGDELFGGYDKYLRFMKSENMSYKEFYENNSVFSKEEKVYLYSENMKAAIKEMDCLDYIDEVLEKKGIEKERKNNLDELNPLLYLETKLLLNGNNLVKPDRMGMGNSIEARMPLLDYRLVEYVSRLSSSYKIRNGETKYIFKKVACELLPKDIVYRRKQMFTVPIGEWLKTNLKKVAYQILMDRRTVERGIFNIDFVKYILDEHVSGKGNYTRQIRLLIIIELWYRIWIDNFYIESPSLNMLL